VILLDKEILKGILQITCNILKNNFFYDDFSLKRFLNIFHEVMTDEYCAFEQYTDEEILEELRNDKVTRQYFTSYFTSANLHDIFVHDMHFTEEELDCFENMLPKYTGVYDNDPKQTNKRAYY
jgi:hypothetical protein